MINPKSAYIIIPVHNRKSVTLRCLNTLEKNGDLDQFQVVVVDDGSTDGTSSAIHDQYPEITVLRGDGNLWWTGAIRRGMEYAYSQGANYLIWLNDDTIPEFGTISSLIQYCCTEDKIIATAQCYSTNSFEYPTYGGQVKHALYIELFSTAKGQQKSCDCMSGNLVCFPRSIVKEIGYPPADRLPHCRADIVYTLKAKRSGYKLHVIGDAVAVCSLNPLDEGWIGSSIPIVHRWSQLMTLKSNIYPPTYWFYCHEVFGWMGSMLFIAVYIKLLCFTILRFLLPLGVLEKMKEFKDGLRYKNPR